MKISLVVAYGLNWEIGKGNEMLWHVPKDFKNFKNITTDHHIVMGRKTFESIGKPLPNRVSLVMSNEKKHIEGAEVFNDVLSLINEVSKRGEEELFVIGGAEVYKLFMPYVDRLYLSEINWQGEADAYLNPIDFTQWKLEEEVAYEEEVANDKVIPSWVFKKYKRN